MKIRHFFVWFGCLFLALQSVWAQNKLYLPETTECIIGETSEIPVYLENTDVILGIQIELDLNEVQSYLTAAPVFKLSDRLSNQFSIDHEGNRVLIYPKGTSGLNSGKGEICRIALSTKATEVLDGKVYAIGFKKAVLSKSGGNAADCSVTGGNLSFIKGRKYPDFAVQDVQIKTTEIIPNGEVTISWLVKNIGEVSALEGWKESVYLVDKEKTVEYFLGSQNHTELLTAGQTISQNVTFKMKGYPGLDGEVYAKVVLTPYADSGELESTRANNTKVSDVSVTLAKLLTLSLSQTTISEDQASSVQGFLYRSGKQLNDETFTITNSNTERLDVPATVVIPKGQSGIGFTIKPVNDDKANPNSEAVLTVTGNGYPQLKQAVKIEDDEKPYLKMSVDKTEVKEGETFRLTVQREWDINQPLVVKLSSDHPKRFMNFPSEVTIPANTNQHIVTIAVTDDDLPGLDDEIVFTAAAPGHEFDLTSGRFVKVIDDDIPNITLELSTSTVSENSQRVVAVLKRTGVTDNKVTVHLTENSEGRIVIPSSVVLDAGITEKEFAIETVDNTLKDGDKTVTIKGAIYISSCNCSASGTESGVFEKQITVLDDDNAAVQCVASKTTLMEGETITITVSVNEILSQDLTVQLTSDNKELQFLSPVKIPAGKRSVDIQITVPQNSVEDGNRVATVVIDAGTYGKSSCWLNITDQTLPDAVITQLTTDKEIIVQNRAKVSVTLKNEGATVLPAQTKVSVYLSTSNQLTGTVTALGALYTQSELAVGESITLEKILGFPEKTGDYYLIAVVNEDQSKKELSYINNNSTPFALTLSPLYTVLVSLDKSVIKTGESVVITGQVNGSQTAEVSVDLYIINNGYRQVVKVKTDHSGIFQETYTPESWQMGHFSVGACYPDEGLTTEMVAFDLYGLKKASTEMITWEVFTNEKTTGTIKLSNPGNRPLSNITAKILSQPQNCQVSFASIASMAANGMAELQYTVTGTAVSPGVDWEKMQVQVTSAEGAELDLDIYYYCRSHMAQLETNEQSIQTTMTIGAVREYPITIVNTGKGETGEIQVVLPDVDWLSLASPAKMASLKYGESATVLLRLVPGADMNPNVAHNGQFAINCANGKGIPVSYRITPVSSATGTLVVDVCDEYTYYTDEKPHVSGAQVRVKMVNTNTVVAEGITDTNGLFTKELPAGYYTLEVTADRHDSYKNTIMVDPGVETKKVINLSFQAITYSWTVEETEIEDQYKIASIVKFETNVPAPVVVISGPKDFDGDSMKSGESVILKFLLTNHGLIAALDVDFILPKPNEEWEFVALDYTELFSLAPQTSVEIPVKLTRLKTSSVLRSTTRRNTMANCMAHMESNYRYICGDDLRNNSAAYEMALKACATSAILKNLYDVYGGGGSGSQGGGGFSGGAGSSIANSSNTPGTISYNQTICDPEVAERANALIDGLIGLMPGFGGVIYGGISNGMNAALESAETGGFPINTIVGVILGEAVNVGGAYIGTRYGDIPLANFGAEVAPPFINFAMATLPSLRSSTLLKTNSWIEVFDEKLRLMYNEIILLRNILKEIYGEPIWYETDDESMKSFWLEMKKQKAPFKIEKLLNIKPEAVSVEQLKNLIERFNNTYNGLISESNSINFEVVKNYCEQALTIEKEAQKAGFDTMLDFFISAYKDYTDNLREESSSVCASITLQLSQSMVMTRQAFRGTLEVYNGHESVAMSNVKLNLTVSDEEGTVATSHEFQISPEKLEGFKGDLEGVWTLNAQETGKATILFIPTKYAAPTEPKKYTFGGTLSYVDPFTGLEVTRDLYPVTMTVKPSPNLAMDYFIQRDVLGDDPLTKEVEPVIPSEFSLLIRNVGAGDATNVQMTTQQPEIVDNEKGLLIDFKIKTSQLNGEEETAVLSESVQTDFGTIEAGKTAYAQWWLTSSLLGHFTEYKVESTHLTSYDNPDLSLLDEVRIHELIRGIRVDESVTPKVTGFMVNDITDAEDFPDMMYLSDGTVAPVVKAADAKMVKVNETTWRLEVTPSANGWNYINIPDPTEGRYRLVGVNDNTHLDTRKVWQTDRTLRDGKDPKYEYCIHAVDYFEGVVTKSSTTAGNFTLSFEARPKTILAVETITGLPETVASTAVGKITVKFNKSVPQSSVTADIITVYCQGEKVDTESVVITRQDEQTYVLDVSKVTKVDGHYTLTILTSEIEDFEGFTGDEDKTVSWTQQAGGKVKLTVKSNPVEAGTVSPTSAEIDYNENVTLKATSATGYQFKNWTINGKEISTDNPYQHTAVTDQTIVANFNPVSYSIEIRYDAAQGSVSLGTGYYEYNSSLQLIATPNEGYRFIGWFIKEKLVSSEELYVYKVNGDAQLEARFETLSNDPDTPEDPNNPDTPDDPNDPNNPTAIEDVETLVIKVYPTRVTDYVHVGVLPAKSRLILFTLSGMQVKQVLSCEGDIDLYMGDQPSGVYVLYILAGEEQKQTVKLIKK